MVRTSILDCEFKVFPLRITRGRLGRDRQLRLAAIGYGWSDYRFNSCRSACSQSSSGEPPTQPRASQREYAKRATSLDSTETGDSEVTPVTAAAFRECVAPERVRLVGALETDSDLGLDVMHNFTAGPAACQDKFEQEFLILSIEMFRPSAPDAYLSLS